jgi:undecaprenol kinase/diacylglycerol kinase (ATP)
MNTEIFTLRSRLKSFRHAFSGIASLLKNEHNSRIHLLAAILAVACGIILKISIPEWCLIVACIGLVFISELLNTSIETIGDAIDAEWNEKIRKAKDYSAAAVLISAIISVIAGGLIFIPRLLKLF